MSPTWVLGDILIHSGSVGFHSLAGAVILQGALKGTRIVERALLSVLL